MTAVLTGVELDTPVPSCPGWSVRDLVTHMGGIHRWANRVVRDRRSDARWMDLNELGGLPADASLFAWFDEGARTLLETLAAAPEDLQCWTFVPATST